MDQATASRYGVEIDEKVVSEARTQRIGVKRGTLSGGLRYVDFTAPCTETQCGAKLLQDLLIGATVFSCERCRQAT